MIKPTQKLKFPKSTSYILWSGVFPFISNVISVWHICKLLKAQKCPDRFSSTSSGFPLRKNFGRVSLATKVEKILLNRASQIQVSHGLLYFEHLGVAGFILKGGKPTLEDIPFLTEPLVGRKRNGSSSNDGSPWLRDGVKNSPILPGLPGISGFRMWFFPLFQGNLWLKATVFLKLWIKNTTIVGRITKKYTYKMCLCFFPRLVKLYVIFPIVFYNIPVVIGDVMSELRQQRLMMMRRMRSQSLQKFRQYLTKKTRRNYQRLSLQQKKSGFRSKVGLFFGTSNISFLGSLGGKQKIDVIFLAAKISSLRITMMIQ